MSGEGNQMPNEIVIEGCIGRWFEEMIPGTTFRHMVTRTATEADNTWFTAITMNPQPLHLDSHYSAGTEFGQRLVNSLFTLSVVVGLSVGDLTLHTTVANLGFGEITFPAPVLIGDTLRAETAIIESRLSHSRPGQGVVTMEHRGYKQDQTLVCRALRTALIRCRPEQSAGSVSNAW
jgi:acyl dehydratase